MSEYGVDRLRRDSYAETAKAARVARTRQSRKNAVAFVVLVVLAVGGVVYALREPIDHWLASRELVVESVTPTVRCNVEIAYDEDNERFLLRLRTDGDMRLRAVFLDADGGNITATMSSKYGDNSLVAPAAFADLDTLKRVESVTVTDYDGNRVNAVGRVSDGDVFDEREDAIRVWSQAQGRKAVEKGRDDASK